MLEVSVFTTLDRGLPRSGRSAADGAVEAVPVLADWTEPAGVPPRGTVVVLPGRGEHPALYARFGRRLSAVGYRVHAVPDPQVDEARVRRRIRALLHDAPAPVVLAGSDGGALFAAVLLSGDPAGAGFAGVVLAGLPTAAADRAAAYRLPASSWPAEVELRTACPEHRELLLRDPATRAGELTRPLPTSWFEAARPEVIDVPVLGVHGADDEISPLAAVREWYARLPQGRLITVAAGRHDALNDRSRGRVTAAVAQFVERASASPAGPFSRTPGPPRRHGPSSSTRARARVEP